MIPRIDVLRATVRRGRQLHLFLHATTRRGPAATGGGGQDCPRRVFGYPHVAPLTSLQRPFVLAARGYSAAGRSMMTLPSKLPHLPFARMNLVAADSGALASGLLRPIQRQEDAVELFDGSGRQPKVCYSRHEVTREFAGGCPGSRRT